MIAVVDYGVGNLRSVEKAMQAVGAQVERLTDAERLPIAEKVVLPGVGSFQDGMEGLRRGGLERSMGSTPGWGFCEAGLGALKQPH